MGFDDCRWDVQLLHAKQVLERSDAGVALVDGSVGGEKSYTTDRVSHWAPPPPPSWAAKRTCGGPRPSTWARSPASITTWGKLVAALERTGLLDQTVVAFTTDHGEYMGEHGTRQEGQWIGS